MGRVGREYLVLFHKGKELAYRRELAYPRHPGHALTSQVLHKAFDIPPAKTSRVVPVHPVLLNPGQKLRQIVPIGTQGLGGIVLPLQGSEKNLQTLCRGHL